MRVVSGSVPVLVVVVRLLVGDDPTNASDLPIVYLRGDTPRTIASRFVDDRLRCEIVTVAQDKTSRIAIPDEAFFDFARGRVDLEKYPLRHRVAGNLYWEMRPFASVAGYVLTSTPRFRLHRIPLAAVRGDRMDWKALDAIPETEAGPPTKPNDDQAIAVAMGPFCVDQLGGYMQEIYESMLIDYVVRNEARGPVRETWRTSNASEAPKSCAYDIVPMDERSIYLVVAAQPTANKRPLLTKTDTKAVGVLRLRLDPPVSNRRGGGLSIDWNGVWEVVEEFESDFVAPFHALRVGDDWWFVTELGTLHKVKRVAPAASQKVQEVRLPDGELIQALVFDEDRDAQPFAFTSKYWFEVKEPLEYHEFVLPTLKPDDPLPTLVACAREVRKLFPAIANEKRVEPSK